MSYEAEFWGDCLNTFGEERKHYVYAQRMGLEIVRESILAGGVTVLDIGGGPASMLLKVADRPRGCEVVDPLLMHWPSWVLERYEAAGIRYRAIRGEDIGDGERYDEAWIYNVLQHVDDPALVLSRARARAKRVRIFEWIGIPAYDGHPHELHARDLRRWLGDGDWRVEQLDESGCVGTAFSGSFGEEVREATATI